MAGNPYGDKPIKATRNPYDDAPANQELSYGKRFAGALSAELSLASDFAAVPFVGLHAMGDYALKNMFGDGTSYEESLQHAENTTGKFIHQEPSTKVGKETYGMLQHGIEAARDYTGRGLENMGRVVSEGTGLKMDTNILRGTGEALFDIGSGPYAIKGYKGAKGRLTRIPKVDELSAKSQEPIMPEVAPEVEVMGRSDPKINDYENLGYDAEGLPKEPTFGEQPVTDPRAEPFLGTEPEVNNPAPEPTMPAPDMGVPFEEPPAPVKPPLATDTFPLPETVMPDRAGPETVDYMAPGEVPVESGFNAVGGETPLPPDIPSVSKDIPLDKRIRTQPEEIEYQQILPPVPAGKGRIKPKVKPQEGESQGQADMREINKGIGGKQSGAVNFGEIADGLNDLYKKAKEKGGEAVEDFARAFKEFMKKPERGLWSPDEGMDETLKRAIEAYKDRPENTAVFRNNERGGAEPRPFNKEYGGKQSGGFHPGEIGAGLAKLFGGKEAERPEPAREPPKEDRRPMVEQKRYLTSDTRNIDKFLQDELGHAKDWTDIKKRWTEFFPGSNIATVAREHKAIKWIGDKVLTADREARVAKENSKYGAEFAPSREITSGKFNRRVRSDDGALTILQRLPIEESSRAIRLWLEKYDGKNVDMNERTLATDGMNKLQIKGLLAAKKQFSDFLTKYNEAAEKEGFSPITVQPNYFPHLWKGDYRIIATDINKQKVWIEGADTELQAKTIRNDLQKKFPDHKVEWKEAGSRYDLDNTDAFRDAIGILDKDDPTRKILQRAFEDILSHRGFKRQTIHREGRPGFLGTKEGTEGLRDAMLAMEMYFDRGHNFLANQQKKAALANLIQGLREGGYDMQRETKNAYNYMNAFVDNSTGGIENGLKLIDNVFESTGEFLGVGKSATSNALGMVNGLASAWWLTTPKFVLAQLVQPVYNLSKAAQLKSAGVTEKSAVASYMKAYYETFFDPSATTVEGLNWAKENGFIDSKILDMMGAKFDPKLKKTAGAFQTFSKWGLGKIEEEVVRAPSFVFYDHLLRDAIPNKVERWTAAGQMTDKYMVDYTRSDTPLMYGRSGLVGEALRPLKQFSHAYYGQMLEYVYDMKHEKTAKPLAMFLGTQLAVAGMKGMIGFAEWTIVATALNSLFNTNIKTGEEWLAEHVGSLLTFGGVSEHTGIDMSGTLGAPQASQMGGFPGVQFAGKAASNVGTYLGDKSSGLDREANEMKALQSIAPNVLQGRVEKAYTPEGQPPPNPNNKMQPDLAQPRTDQDQLMRDMGGRSVKEAQEMLRLKALRQETKMIETQRGKYLDTMVDRLVQGKDVDQDLIDGYVERGGDPNNIANSIVEQMKNRMKGAGERYLNATSPNMSTAEKAMRLQKYNLLTDQITDPDEMAKLLKEIDNAK